MDLTPFTDASGDITTAVGTVGAATVAVYVAARGFRFVRAWIGKLFSAGQRG